MGKGKEEGKGEGNEGRRRLNWQIRGVFKEGRGGNYFTQCFGFLRSACIMAESHEREIAIPLLAVVAHEA